MTLAIIATLAIVAMAPSALRARLQLAPQAPAHVPAPRRVDSGELDGRPQRLRAGTRLETATRFPHVTRARTASAGGHLALPSRFDTLPTVAAFGGRATLDRRAHHPQSRAESLSYDATAPPFRAPVGPLTR